VVGEDRGAVGRDEAGGVEQVLDGERNAVRRERVGPSEEDSVVYES